jgi:hypothetical protein
MIYKIITPRKNAVGRALCLTKFAVFQSEEQFK